MNIKKLWGGLATWKKWAIIFMIIHLVPLIISLITGYINYYFYEKHNEILQQISEFIFGMYYYLIDFIFVAISYGIYRTLKIPMNFHMLVLSFIFGTLFYGCIGALIGYITQIIKDRK